MPTAPPPGSAPEPAVLREVAVAAATAAGELLLTFAADLAAGADLDVGHKSSATDPVSAADAAAERAIVEHLLAAFPDDGILGEEGQDPREGTSGRTWVIDPLDGTVNFLYGSPVWSVSIACRDADGPVVAVVAQPTLGEVFHAARGLGAWLGDQRLHVREVAEPAQTLVHTGFSYDVAIRTDWARDVRTLLGTFRDIRRPGSAALDLAWVAAGRADAFVEFGLGPWDWAAGHLLVLEAGGVVTEHRRHLGGQHLAGIVAGGQDAHDALVATLELGP